MRGERKRVRREERIEEERVARPEAFSMMERSMMEMMGATITPALAALAKSAKMREERFLVFHLLLVVEEVVLEEVATAGEAAESARP